MDDKGSIGETVPRPFAVFRVVLLGMLVGLLWKVAMFATFDHVYQSLPIRDSFFPAWLQSAMTLRAAYLLAVGAVCLAMRASSVMVCRITMIVGLVATSILMLHQGTYNDMTFTTVWWCNVWCLWYASRMGIDSEEALIGKAAFLGRFIVSIVLLGGAAGKWTPEYWSGDVFYEIYFVDRDYWVFNVLRATFDEPKLRWIAMIYSRKVVVLETLAGLGLWLLPPRWAAWAGAGIFVSIVVLSNIYLVSVLAPMVGLSLVGLWVRRVT